MILIMLESFEMAELLIAAHGLDDALYQACERLLCRKPAKLRAWKSRTGSLP
jgi:hypothetical protein